MDRAALVRVIDCEALRRGLGDALAGEALRDVVACARTTGIALLRGHGIDPAVIRGARREARRFFDRPLHEKLAASSPGFRGYKGLPAGGDDFKESFFFDVGMGEAAPAGSPFAGENVWPADDGFRAAITAYARASMELARSVLAWVTDGVPGRAELLRGFERASGAVRTLRYPPASETGTRIGANEHVDAPALALLDVGDVPGLEWRDRDGAWHPVPIVEGTLVLQIGGYLERWTNGILVANLHRVRNRTDAARVSIAFFLHPSFDAVLPCQPPETYFDFLTRWVTDMGPHGR